jgi:hypothetical protein
MADEVASADRWRIRTWRNHAKIAPTEDSSYPLDDGRRTEAMVEIIPDHPLDAVQVGQLVHLLGVSIGHVRRCSERREPVLRIEVFGGRWQDERVLLVLLHRAITTGQAPLSIRDTDDGSQRLSTDELRARLLFWRGIELEQERATYLEIGAIASPSEFESAEPDWTSSLTDSAAR